MEVHIVTIILRCGFANNDRCLHCKPSDRQVDESTRHYLVLPIWFSCRHTGCCRHCSIPARALCHDQWQAPHDTDCCVNLPGDLLRQQGPTVVRSANPTSSQIEADTNIIYRAGLIIAGWDERFGGQVYSIPLGGSLHKQSYAIGGSGSTYIYGYCDANWREGMEKDDAVNFVKGALREAIKWDGSSGGVIRMVVLTKDGADRHLYLPDTDYAVRHE